MLNRYQTKQNLILICDMIAQDAEDDVNKYEGMPMDGKTMAAYQGEQNAMIQALARVVRDLVELLP